MKEDKNGVIKNPGYHNSLDANLKGVNHFKLRISGNGIGYTTDMVVRKHPKYGLKEIHQRYIKKWYLLSNDLTKIHVKNQKKKNRCYSMIVINIDVN